MAEIGWIGLHRKISEHWIFPRKREFTEFEAWIYLLINASFAESKIKEGNVLHTIKRGDLLTSELKLSIAFKWNRNKVRRFLYLLENDAMITKNSNTKFTIITICNYDSYQDFKPAAKQRTNNKRTTDDQQTNTLKEGKEDKRSKEDKEASTQKKEETIVPASLKYPVVTSPAGAEVIFSIEHCLEVAVNDGRWVSANQTNRKELEAFNKLLEKAGTYQRNPLEWKKHFAHWKAKNGNTIPDQELANTQNSNILSLIKNAGK